MFYENQQLLLKNKENWKKNTECSKLGSLYAKSKSMLIQIIIFSNRFHYYTFYLRSFIYGTYIIPNGYFEGGYLSVLWKCTLVWLKFQLQTEASLDYDISKKLKENSNFYLNIAVAGDPSKII